MARRFRRAKVQFNTKLMVETAVASLIVQKAPQLVGKYIPFDPQLQTIIGAGIAYVAAMFTKKPNIANVAIALALLDFVSPMIDDLIGGTAITSGGTSGGTQTAQTLNVADYVRLNEYTNSPQIQMPMNIYKDSY